jgi:ATP-dependent RNA helicase DDX60
LFLLTTFPFIALSATISNAKKIYRWLENLQNYRTDFHHSKKMHLIEHSVRHNDVKRFIYTSRGFKSVHPVGCLNVSSIEKHEKLPSDLHLSSRETLQFYDALKKAYPKSEELQELDPEYTSLLKIKPNESLFITRKSAKIYEEELKRFFLDSLLQAEDRKDAYSKASQVIRSLKINFDENEFYPRFLSYNNSNAKKEKSGNVNKEKSANIQSFIDLVMDLKKENLLPCIVFTNNRILCEKFATGLADFLENSDQTLADESNNEDNDKTDEIFSKLSNENIPSIVSVGVGWHHSGLSKNKKAVVEALFRIGKIKLVVATGTLALGIHMPCKTVVFMDDSIYLDSFQYRQASGRAGRRGFDQNGNVVFFDIGLTKLKRLVGSFIPEIRPHFPLSVSFAMNFFDFEFRKKKPSMAVECLLNKSFWNYSYHSKVSQVHYDAVFSLNFLMDMNLLNENGKFSLFSNLLERIYYHEPSNFLLYYLFVKGNFHEIKKTSSKVGNESDMEKIMLIICHLFNQHPKRKPDKYMLPSLPDNVEQSINEYNTFVIKSYTNFFIHLSAKLKENPTSDLNRLPLSQISFTPREENAFLKKFMKNWNYEYSFVSPFAALSAIRDENLLTAKSDLFFNCLGILHIDSKIIPIFPRIKYMSDYGLKFFNEDLEIDELKEQGILIGDLVDNLKDFKTILNSINNCVSKIAPEKDAVRTLFDDLSVNFEEKFLKFMDSLIQMDDY